MDDSTEVGLHAAASLDLKLLNPVISSSTLTAGLKYLPLIVLCSRLRRTQAKLYGEDDMCLNSLRMLTKGEFGEPAGIRASSLSDGLLLGFYYFISIYHILLLVLCRRRCRQTPDGYN